ncbi:tyrosine-protein phosphatase [Flammeovirgaceae bacterium SG7u.111]|nr:tyrosine-protein phosphatase [Flammeovirgaceae bacterium SG7u.132]WPO35206.1 tyrosine-protein phosphatase [Flammeovirgaceae bacterium SG7u.111]
MKILIPAKLLLYPFWANYVDWDAERNPMDISGEFRLEGLQVENLEELLKGREIIVAGVDNFRELGGHQLADGRKLKKGLLFRSGHADSISSAGMAVMKGLGIKTIADFRSEAEVSKRRRGNLAEEGMQVHALPIFNQGEVRKVKAKLLSGEISFEESEQMMRDVYRYFVESGADSLKQFFQLLLEEKNYPILFHCTAGKDRTGFAAALLMKMLGFSTEQILVEYILTNLYRKQANLTLAKKASLFVKKEALLPLLEVRQEYLKHAFQLIDQLHGSFENYQNSVLGIGEKEVEMLKEMLLS